MSHLGATFRIRLTHGKDFVGLSVKRSIPRNGRNVLESLHLVRVWFIPGTQRKLVRPECGAWGEK